MEQSSSPLSEENTGSQDKDTSDNDALSASVKEFENELTEFFRKYRKSKLSVVPKIASKMAGHRETVMQHLHEKYGEHRKKFNVEHPGKKSTAPGAANSASEGSSETTTETDPHIGQPKAASKKSRKKVLVFSLFGILIVAGAAAGWLFKDQFTGAGTTEKKNTAQTPAGETAAPQPEEKAAIIDQVEKALEESAPAEDTSKSTSDSANTL